MIDREDSSSRVTRGDGAKIEQEPDSLPRIDSKFVHKYNPRNVLLSRVDRMKGKEDWFEAELTPDWEHPFFFEHPVDHVPSLMLVEAGRQVGLAISHLHLGIPLDSIFVSNSYDIRFTDFADIRLGLPVIIRGRVTKKQYRREKLFSLRLDGSFHQGERDLEGMGGLLTIYSRAAILPRDLPRKRWLPSEIRRDHSGAVRAVRHSCSAHLSSL